MDYDIDAYPITPPVGKIYGWGAKFKLIIDGKKVQGQEFLGQTREEAYKKALEDLKTKHPELFKK